MELETYTSPFDIWTCETGEFWWSRIPVFVLIIVRKDRNRENGNTYPETEACADARYGKSNSGPNETLNGGFRCSSRSIQSSIEN
jgi:hypothetical protein